MNMQWPSELSKSVCPFNQDKWRSTFQKDVLQWCVRTPGAALLG
jgi:hypothetical protein